MGSNYSFATVVDTVNHPTVFFLFFPEAIRCPGYWLGQRLPIHNLDFSILLCRRIWPYNYVWASGNDERTFWVLGVFISIIWLENDNDWNNLGRHRLRMVPGMNCLLLGSEGEMNFYLI